MTAIGPLGGIVLFALAIAAAVLVMLFIVVPLFKGVGWLISALFQGVGWIVRHVFEFVAGMLSDAVRFVGAVLASIVLMPLALLSVVIARWSAAGHYAASVKREWKVAGACLYRLVLRRPLKLVLLHGLLEGLEQRVPEAVAAAPSADRPSRRAGQFDGYEIVGSLKGGGSGAKLYIAKPDDTLRRRGMPERVVIKSFAVSEGSTLPQIVRESRALECAKQLGLVLDHGLDTSRFFYAMPYHAGDHLGIVVRQLHGESEVGLRDGKLHTALGYVRDLVATLSSYHEGGLWHKDVKPENIIIVGDGTAQLVDLGLITPLRSAMTLTTHGTEYFRDPEMVRLALRGVKVHQVNGAKFDIFAAGAVLYFVFENTFPPHGALSRFTDRTPDALRWIVRRAMADYAHRYESAEDMLADISYVLAAPVPARVRPADLPSVHGGGAAAASFAADADQPEPEFGPEIEMGPAARHASTPRPRSAAHVAAAASAAGEAVRPRLRVTNWWTGEYASDHGTAAPAAAAATPAHDPRASAFHVAARTARDHAARYRTDVQEIGRKLAEGSLTARQAARAQIRAARRRAQEMRRAAHAHAAAARHPRRAAKVARSSAAAQRAVAEKQPSAMLGAIGACTLLFAAATVFLAVRSNSGSDHASVISSPDGARMIVSSETAGAARPLIVINRLHDHIRDSGFDRVVREYADEYDVVIDENIESEIAPLLHAWERDSGDHNDLALEDALEDHDLYGVLTIDRSGLRTHGAIVWSTREGAKDRRYVHLPPMRGDYLVVNDHPTKHDDATMTSIDAALQRYARQGYDLLIDDEDAEVDVRKSMPAVPGDDQLDLTDRLAATLHDHDLAGILYIDAGPGDGPVRDRIRVRSLDGD